MTSTTPLDPSEDVVLVLRAIARRSLARRGLTDLLARLDAPGTVVTVDVDADHAVRVLVDGEVATVVPSADLGRTLRIARAGRGSAN